jgi:hypothetical protein
MTSTNTPSDACLRMYSAQPPELAWRLSRGRPPCRAGALRIVERMIIPLTGTQHEIEQGDHRAT